MPRDNITFKCSECGEENWFMNFFASGDDYFQKQYYANDLNLDFVNIACTNNKDIENNIYLVNEDNKMTISLKNIANRKYLEFSDAYEKVFTIDVDDANYEKLNSVMNKYQGGFGLRNFLLEGEFSKYLNYIAIQDPEFYYEVIGFDNTQSLNLKTL